MFIFVIYLHGGSQTYDIIWILYSISAITDFFDGYFARKMNVTSNFGRCLDPIADKLLILSMLILLAHAHIANFILCTVILFREIIISGLREFLGQLQVVLPVSRLAKWKTGFQIVGIGSCVFVKAPLVVAFFTYIGTDCMIYPIRLIMENQFLISDLLMITATALSVITGAGYIKETWKYIK